MLTSLKRLHDLDENYQMMKRSVIEKKIESAIIQDKYGNFKQSRSTEMCKNKT